MFLSTQLKSVNILNLLLFNLNNFKLNLLIIVLLTLLVICVYKQWFFLILWLILFSFLIDSNASILNSFFTGYYKIHPPAFYFSLIVFLFYIYTKQKFIKYSIYFILRVLLFTFCLGSMWALTQFIWGRYWSNDSIEVILILLILNSVIYIHKLYKNNSVYYNFFIFNIILLVFLLRLNFIFTKHNFFQKLINLQIYCNIVYIAILSYIAVSFNSNKNKVSLINKYYSLTLYALFVQIVFNYINVFLIKQLNLFFVRISFSFVIIYVTLISYNYLIHWFILIIVVIFNISSPIYVKHFFHISLQNIESYVDYFLVKKNCNLWIFKKINMFLNFFSLKQNHIVNKNFSAFQDLNNTRVNIVNFF